MPMFSIADVFSPSLGAGGHDHALCRRIALERAEGVCRMRGARFTDMRRRVLDLLWQDHRPVSAYELLRRLNKEAVRSAAPAAVYRALEFLIEQGLAHRLLSLNAFVGCPCPERHEKVGLKAEPKNGADSDGGKRGVQFLICKRCGDAVELADAAIHKALEASAESVGFRVEAPALEVSGVCGFCCGQARE